MELTHASFFSGVGGLDLGLERAGWRTVSFSEIDRYASAVLAERWPAIPNLGDITALSSELERDGERPERVGGHGAGDHGVQAGDGRGDGAWHAATLWTGGFPCQDLSVAGKRRGLDGARSGLAFAYLALVERHRPPVIVLENVPGLLSSNEGRDLGRLVREMADIGYVGAYRVLDARHFGVPQRRRRVFIVAIRADLDPAGERAAEVLAVGHRCGGHPPAGVKARPDAAGEPRTGLDIAGALTRRYAKGINSTIDDGAIVVGAVSSRPYDDRGHEQGHLIPVGADPPDDARGDRAPGGRQEPGREGGEGPADPAQHVGDAGHGQHGDPVRRPDGSSADAARDGAADGLAGRLDDRAYVAEVEVPSRGDSPNVAGTVDSIGHGPRTATAIVGGAIAEVDLLPEGLDSHRYRCCGNGVVAPVAEWIGRRLAAFVGQL